MTEFIKSTLRSVSLIRLEFLCICPRRSERSCWLIFFHVKYVIKPITVWQAPPTRLCAGLSFASRNSLVVHNRPLNIGRLSARPPVCICAAKRTLFVRVVKKSPREKLFADIIYFESAIVRKFLVLFQIFSQFLETE